MTRATKTGRLSMVYIWDKQGSGEKTERGLVTIDVGKRYNKGCYGNNGELAVKTEDGNSNLKTKSTMRARSNTNYSHLVRGQV